MAAEGEGWARKRRMGEGLGREEHGKTMREGGSERDEGGGGERRLVEDASQVY